MSKLSLASKFGVGARRGRRTLLFAARQAADALGICFHVGSQAMTPDAYAQAMERVRAAIVEAAVTVDVIDVGGGFPRPIRAWSRRRSKRYFETIHRAFESLPVSYSSELWASRAARCAPNTARSIVRVEKRRGDELFINDGAYGALFDAAHIGWRFPVALLREPDSRAKDMPFSFYGPTCDDLDHMAGPFLLPADVAGGRLYRDRDARRLRLGDADRVQRLRIGRDGDRRGRTDGVAVRRRGRARSRRTSSRCNGASSYAFVTPAQAGRWRAASVTRSPRPRSTPARS